MRLTACNNVMDFRRLAKRRLPTPVFHYIDGGADDEVALARSTEAFNEYELLPSQLSDVSNVDLSSTLFGQPVDWPVMIAPTGASKLFHATGEQCYLRPEAFPAVCLQGPRSHGGLAAAL
jgi:L-lactate dehydrogenase (cytochrome)